MLTVQVNYQGVQETIRHNQVAEGQNKRHLDQEDTRIQQNWQNLEEIKRHNLATERLTSRSIAETARHNAATESLGYQNLSYNYQALHETARHNMMNEGIAWAGLRLDNRKLAETTRHNIESESISRFANDTNRARMITEGQQGWASLSNARRANELRWMELGVSKYRAQTDRARQITDAQLGMWHNINESVRVGNEVFKSFGKTFENWDPVGDLSDNLFQSIVD